MLIGYARVSKSDGSQTLAPQRDALIGAGVEPDRIYQDLASGRHDARPGLSACLKALQPGNTLVLWKLDRLGRDLKHLVETAESLRTPLQIERHLTLAFEEGFRIGEKPITTEVVEAVLSQQIDDLEPRLTRHGYSVRTLAEQFNAKPVEIKRLLRGELDAARARELTDEMLAAGTKCLPRLGLPL